MSKNSSSQAMLGIEQHLQHYNENVEVATAVVYLQGEHFI
jgi:hypothetical protein